MPASLDIFDMSVSVTAPKGHKEPLPITLAPNWKNNDYRFFFVSGSGVDTGGASARMMPMSPDPPAGFTSAYALNAGKETHGVYYRRLQTGDNSTFVNWVKPTQWVHFMVGMVTIRGMAPGGSVTAGTLSGWRSGANGIQYLISDATNSVTVKSVTVPSAGVMIFFLGNIATPGGTQWPNWPVATGVPTNWIPWVATPNSGNTYYPYDTNPSVNIVAKRFNASGSTGDVVFPAGQGNPAWSGLWAFVTAAADVSVNVGAA